MASDRRLSESENDVSKSGDAVSVDDEGQMQTKETAYRHWRSMLVKSGQGSFLHPHKLKEKLSLQMTKYGL